MRLSESINPSTLNRSRVIQFLHGKQATEARGKVYALYGLSSALGISIVGQPDYGKPIAQIYEEETRAAIKGDLHWKRSTA